ncbi:cupin domain-containing protein [Thermoleophilia bacterium SCSIO 60948]|nr:cupin domain-containing protein [Thermoleophilia bacterium SCSIO 60948]
MSAWTKINFAEITDWDGAAPAGISARFARRELDSPELGVSRFSYRPGARFPFAHRHREQQEVYVVIGGTGHVKLDDEVVELFENDVVRVAPEVARQFEAGPDGLDLICIGGRRPEGGDGERVDGFWD